MDIVTKRSGVTSFLSTLFPIMIVKKILIAKPKHSHLSYRQNNYNVSIGLYFQDIRISSLQGFLVIIWVCSLESSGCIHSSLLTEFLCRRWDNKPLNEPIQCQPRFLLGNIENTFIGNNEIDARIGNHAIYSLFFGRTFFLIYEVLTYGNVLLFGSIRSV